MTMPNAREPLLNPVPITELRPTPITVGLREVKPSFFFTVPARNP
jgi:hypothetical protein